MSLLTSCNQVLRETGFPDVTTVVGNGNQAVRALLAQAQRQGKQMAKKRWSILTKRTTFTTVSSAEAYALPTDFYKFVDETQWNTSDNWPQVGPLSEEDWQDNKSGQISITVNDRWHIRADGNSNRFFIDPVPTTAENVSFFYVTDTWCRAAGGQRQNEFKKDDDVILLDTDVFELGLKWRFLRAQQREYRDEQAEYIREEKKAYAVDGGMKDLRITPVRAEDFLFRANVGETNFGS